ncbi:MAG TPA: hypothetical protein VIF82_13550 [Burkholderiaceae bacterium]|jgi:hypothetical protein
MNNIKLVMIFVVITMSLSACGGSGGGGSGGTTGTTVTSTTTTTLPVSTIVTSVTAANYAAGDRLDSYNYLNSQRGQCGFGLLQQQAKVDQAAQAHTDYEWVNQIIVSHTEVSSNAGFTGVDVGARLTAATYPWISGDEVLNAMQTTYGTSFGQANVMGWFTSPFHGIGQLMSNRDIGVGADVYTPSDPAFLPSHILTMDFGSTATRPPQLLGGADVVTYPCAGITGVLSKSYFAETPAPLGRNLQSQPIGQPIYLKVRDGQTLTVTSATLNLVGNATPIALVSLSRANDTTGLIPDNSWVVLMPNVPLAINSSYQFTANVTNNGVPSTVSFTFATGAN